MLDVGGVRSKEFKASEVRAPTIRLCTVAAGIGRPATKLPQLFPPAEDFGYWGVWAHRSAKVTNLGQNTRSPNYQLAGRRASHESQ